MAGPGFFSRVQLQQRHLVLVQVQKWYRTALNDLAKDHCSRMPCVAFVSYVLREMKPRNRLERPWPVMIGMSTVRANNVQQVAFVARSRCKSWPMDSKANCSCTTGMYQVTGVNLKQQTWQRRIQVSGLRSRIGECRSSTPRFTHDW